MIFRYLFSFILVQISKCLVQVERLASHTEDGPGLHDEQSQPRPKAKRLPSSRRLWQGIAALGAALLACFLLDASALLTRSHPQLSSPSLSPIATGPTAHIQAGGIEASMHLVTAGPYFLSELVEVKATLTNQTQTTLLLGGVTDPESSPCVQPPLAVALSSSASAPLLTLPAPAFPMGCDQPLIEPQLAPGRSWTLHRYLPVTWKGEVRLTMETNVLADPDPLAGHWPSLSIQVDPIVPSHRMIWLQVQGKQVIIEAPPQARTHLLYKEAAACGTVNAGCSGDWTPLSGTVLSEPVYLTCPMWTYVVGAPGYQMVSGSLPLGSQ
jgi:hypothetical protein